jgi:hypothetical protein
LIAFCVVSLDQDKGFAKKSAELDITLRNPGGDRRTVSDRLIVPADTFDQVSRRLIDLFPAVSADDLDWI